MKKPVITDQAPAAIGPYSQGIDAGSLVFTSGQLPIDMATGDLELLDIRKATRNALSNVEAVLKQGGSSMDQVVKTTVFLTDLADFAAMNEEYAAFFPGVAPARSCVQVAALPKDVKIEIEAIAVK